MVFTCFVFLLFYFIGFGKGFPCTSEAECQKMVMNLSKQTSFFRGDQLPLKVIFSNSSFLFFPKVDVLSRITLNAPKENETMFLKVMGSNVMSTTDPTKWSQNMKVVPFRLLIITLEYGQLMGIEWESTACRFGCECINDACAMASLANIDIDIGWKGTDNQGNIMTSYRSL
jgi:hypothetical protein